MRRKTKFSVCPLALVQRGLIAGFCIPHRILLIAMGFFFIIGCSDDGDDPLPETRYNLSLEVNPEGAGSVAGAGEYSEGEQVNISATAEGDWEFLIWVGDMDLVEEPNSANTRLTMPSQDVTLTAKFQVDPIYGGGVTDIDSNEYITVIIGEQEWMAENLRVTRDANGNDISRHCYDHDPDWCDLYGGLYTWSTIMNGESSSDSSPSGVQGICPAGWHIPSDAEWAELINFLAAQGFPNSDTSNGAANALKSCKQVDSPLGGGCDTSEHPRWDPHNTHYGFDEFGFSALPGGSSSPPEAFFYLGAVGAWWSATEFPSDYGLPSAWVRVMAPKHGNVHHSYYPKSFGLSLRCVRDND